MTELIMRVQTNKQGAPNFSTAEVIDAVEVVRGEWKPLRGRYAECSVCEESYYMPHLRWSNFCPCCGARMGGERKESE